MKIERELMRGGVPVAVLKLLSGKRRYGYELVEALTSQPGELLKNVGQSALYALLYNLESKGLIEGRWQGAAETGAGVVGHRKRKYYMITYKGKKRLVADSKKWQTLVEAMAALEIVGDGQPVSFWIGSGRKAVPA